MDKFDEHEKELTKYFSRAYDDIEAKIGDVKLVLTEFFVARATGFPRIGEIWFKNRRIKEKEWSFFSTVQVWTFLCLK